MFHRRSPIVAVLAIVVVLACQSGCAPAVDPRTSNQGGGNIVTAGSKVAAGSMAALTPDEIQILADNFAPEGTPALNDEQAAAMQQFLVANDVNTVDDISRLIGQAQTDLSSIELPEGFLELFLGFATEVWDQML
ncbi:MAG: hypothetical protein JXA69_13790 [Phycisphaerae bacterium]|nr:hypothetical protein [Phycisphaerae bacterium]